ncbi:MAG: zinc ribbon domain-containing protein [Ignavibacteria bacterium]|nr:zinc ribbon domain-containing protein [Ignavibacteria bacterium]
MPTYEYQCNNCGYIFETFQSIKELPLKKCPRCNKDTVKRLISGGAGLIFKGTGFYLTDYKRKPPKQENKTSEVKPKEEKSEKKLGDKSTGDKK